MFVLYIWFPGARHGATRAPFCKWKFKVCMVIVMIVGLWLLFY